ncbi:MAG: rRNA cytosine-C5-methyltransferase [Flavobacteriales bacterium]|nr:rRNA cytosine-C5-methyltransferase [Flavobacteriales bacterium]
MTRNELLALVASRTGVLDAASQQAFVDAHDAPPPVSIRINGAKWQRGPLADPVPWATGAYYLDHRPTFTFDPLFHAGAYYVQEAGSMFLEQAVNACGLLGADCVALDLCAAPGGKSTHLLSLLGADALLVSNEVVRPRARILCDNIAKWGRANACVTGSDPALFSGLPHLFDLVVVDAPCSGEGLFRKDTDAMQHWSDQAVAHCASRQCDILQHAWTALRPGGHLIYSTCTYNRAENEENVARMVEWGGTCIPVPLREAWGITEAEGQGVIAYRFMPHLTRAEGFFLSIIRKPGHGEASGPSAPKGFWKELPANGHLPWMPMASDHLTMVRHGERIVAVTPRLYQLFPSISRQVYPLQFGVEVAHTAKGQWMPSHAYAAAAFLTEGHFQMIDVQLADAVQYLRGNPLPASGAKGFAAVRYRGLVLGLVKGAGNRWNNLYPTALRIRDMRTALADVVTAPL